MQLTDLPPRTKAYISDVRNDFNFIKRLTALGIGINQTIEIYYKAPFGGPFYVLSSSNRIILRRSDADRITVNPITE